MEFTSVLVSDLLSLTVTGVFAQSFAVAVPVCVEVTAQEGAEHPPRCFQTMTPLFPCLWSLTQLSEYFTWCSHLQEELL